MRKMCNYMKIHKNIELLNFTGILIINIISTNGSTTLQPKGIPQIGLSKLIG